MIDKYRAVLLGSPLGLEVLTDLLFELRFGCTIDPDNQQQVAQHNLAMLLLGKCGVLAPGTLGDVVKALSSVAPEIETEKKPIL